MTGIGWPAPAQTAADRAIDRAAASRPIPGNRVELLIDGPQTFDAMLNLIDHARRWIHFDNYIIRDDETGDRFADALERRARDGLPVRVSADWLGSFGTGRAYWRRLSAAGVSVRQFNRPRLLDLPSYLTRNHRKLVAADGTRAVVGGVCIGNEWAGNPATGQLPWRDTAVLVEGPAAASLDLAFGRTWELVGEPLPPDEVPAEVAAAGTASVRVMVGEPVRERAYRATEFLLAGASSRVWVTDAYLVAPRRLYQALTDAAKAGVDVRLLVPGTSDLPLVRNLTRIGYRELLRAGVRIYEWNGPMLHAKTVVADGRWVRVGSSNLNHSSLLANYELDVLVDDERLATKMEAQFRLDIDQSAEVRVRPLRAPSAITRMLPPALAIPDPARPSGHRRGMRERRGRSVLVVRTLAAGARLAVFGPVSLALALVAVLFFVIPKAMGILFGTFSLWLSLVAGAEAIHRRRDS